MCCVLLQKSMTCQQIRPVTSELYVFKLGKQLTCWQGSFVISHLLDCFCCMQQILTCVVGMQALALCQHGKEDLADTILTRLNCTYRLAPAVLMLNAQGVPATISANPVDKLLPCIIRGAVSGALLNSHYCLGPYLLLGKPSACHHSCCSGAPCLLCRGTVQAAEVRPECNSFLLDGPSVL